MAGKSPAAHEEPGVENLDVDYTFFDQHVWPDIAKRVPAFENIKVFIFELIHHILIRNRNS